MPGSNSEARKRREIANSVDVTRVGTPEDIHEARRSNGLAYRRSKLERQSLEAVKAMLETDLSALEPHSLEAIYLRGVVEKVYSALYYFASYEHARSEQARRAAEARS